jgi:GT2 family glycosyltransferase
VAGDEPALAVVVMGYRDGATIERAVRSVVDQVRAGDEVVVVTSGGDDSAARVRRAFPALTVVEATTRLLPGGARNVGIAATTAPVVAFLAADCVATSGWVEGRRRRHAEGHDVVATAVGNLDRSRPAAWAFHFGLYANRLAGRPAGPIPATDGGAHGCSFTRELLERLGGFEPTLRIGEDTEAVRALHRLGVPVWFEPAVVTLHAGPRSLIGLVAERYRRGRRRAAVRGAVADGWAGVAREWAQSSEALARRARRWSGPDRGWLYVCLPWFVVGQAAALVGQQWWARERS